MSVIIRLQNLPWSANAHDIRQFFKGLSIPEGGVHIVGGELGDAFIGFSTDEDARQAFNLNGGKIKEVQVKLMLSSRAEMYKIIEAARNPLVAFLQVPPMTQPLTPLMPTPVLEVKKEDKEKKSDRRRSRSKSRDRKERSRDRDRRDRRRRDRSRSRSRDRRDRRRRDRSHSRDRRSKDRDRRRRSEESSNNSNVAGKELPKTGVWEEPSINSLGPSLAPAALQQVFLNSLIPKNLEEVSRNINTITPPSLLSLGRNGMSSLMEPNLGRAQDNWNNSPSHQNMNVRSDFPSIFNKIAPQLGGDNNNLNTLMVRPQNIHQFLGNVRMPFGGGRRNTRFDQQEDSELPRKCELGFCVQLRPYYGGYGEVRRFFQGLYIHNTGIKFLNDDNGKRTGIVYIRFATTDGKRDALLRDGEQLKTQKVEVKHLDDDVFNETIDSYQPLRDRNSPDSRLKRNRDSSPISSSPLTQFSCLAIENLPLFTKEQDMLKIFSDYSLLSILLINKQRHQTAYIKFSNIEDAKVAQEEKSMHIFDGTPLTIRPCSDEEFAEISKEEQEEVIEVEDDEEADYPTSDCVMLNGLPLKTSDRDISDFFSDVAIVPNRIHMVNSNLGFTGTAFCEFSSTSDAEIALDKNGLPLGSGIITVTSVTRKEMENKIGSANFGNSGPTSLLNLPRPPFFPRGNFGSPRGNMGMRPSLMGPRPNMRRFRPPPASDPIDLAPPGHTVRMENVPYKAVLDEILDFFDGFDVPVDNVLRRYNENGTPSGEAKVIFKSANEAHQAVQERNRNKIRDRVIFLSQC